MSDEMKNFLILVLQDASMDDDPTEIRFSAPEKYKDVFAKAAMFDRNIIPDANLKYEIRDMWYKKLS